MRRRPLLAVGLAWPLLPGRGLAQPRMARVGCLFGSAPEAAMMRGVVDPLRQGLRELGYAEGRNLTLHFRWAEGRADRLPALATELLALGLDVLVTSAPRPALVVKAATSVVPIVAVAVDDPVAMGLVATMARPGGNVTGISGWGIEILAKRLQLMKDLVPKARRVGVLANPSGATRGPFIDEFEQRLGLKIAWVAARGPEDFDAAFAALSKEQVEGVLVLADPTFFVHRARIAELCRTSRLPSVWGGRDYLDGGGLASYQSDFPAMFRRAAALVDKILKGAKPGEIPFEQASRFDLVLNLKAARALGLAVPQVVLVQATEVID